MQKRKGVVLAAPKSGSGKTLITCALIEALKEAGVNVCAFKCGPDYIDPMFHRTILGVPGGNLDTYFTGEAKTKELFIEETPEDAFAVVEGVMGLYDGLGGILEEGSTYHLAKSVSLPVILVIDAHGMGRTILPLIQGLLSYDRAGIIKGVILNRVTKMFYASLKELIESELSIEVLGYFTEQKELHLESRHLGLKLPEEKRDLKEQVCRRAASLKETVSLERILAIGGAGEKDAASQRDDDNKDKVTSQRADIYENDMVFQRTDTKENDSYEKKLRLAIAKDEAFCFYYQENLKLLSKMGFELVPFSPLHDKKLPEHISGLLLGGGYPELFAKELSENESMKTAIREAIRGGLPSLAECGGFLYLHKSLKDMEGRQYSMAGIIDADADYRGKLVRFGYVELTEKESHFLPEKEGIRGHEFHYFDSTENGTDCVAKKPTGNRSWECVWEGENHWWGFPHLYYPSNPSFVEHFYRQAGVYQQSKLK
ncbi:MAG: cobyrinate a,c-diamide synthase [Lachnospiraceae bacterium]|nr:cobyrinate a,c-diamide synthase [Lachnospiraceae bacterium]MDD6305136.1 cobyrinate a,c-diamide synthase [Lachnospiraceae bacterium]